MSKVATTAPSTPLRAFGTNGAFISTFCCYSCPWALCPSTSPTPRCFAVTRGIGERVAADVQVGPWSLTLAEFRNEGPRPAARPAT